MVKKSNTYVYKLGNETYINLTNKCTNDCEFCLRNGKDGFSGYDLWLAKEPTANEVIELLKDKKPNVVFCGFGEPTIKIEELKQVAAFVKSYGGHVRINTNGHGNAFHKRNIAPELRGIVDEVSISLNETDAEKYAEITKSAYGADGYAYMLDFARECVKNGITVTLSVVDVIGKDEIEACRKIAQDIGARFRVRKYVE
jgi:TatD family-associated radical SAM protein